MAFDLLIKNGRVIDGSGMPAFKGDVGISRGRIAELGKLSGPAKRTIDAEERVVSPGFVDNHCHFDAQVTWDPLCSFSPQHGATTVVSATARSRSHPYVDTVSRATGASCTTSPPTAGA